MMRTNIVSTFAALAIFAGFHATAAPPINPAAQTTVKKEEIMSDAEILKWKDGKKAVFMLAFDDSCVTHVKNAIPELKKRGMTGTFYINPGNGPLKSQINAWEKEIPKTGMEYGNHTFTHAGALSVGEFETELEKSNEFINKCFPDRKVPRLISYGRPGVPKEKWKITKEEEQKAIAKYNLIERPSFFGYPFHAKTKEDVLKL